MLDMILKIFKIFFDLLLPVLAVFGIMTMVFFLLCLFWYVYFYKKGMRVVKDSVKKVEPIPLWKQLFFYLPRRFVLDFYSREEDYFDVCGLHIFCGERGSGKTIAMCEMILRLQQGYPKSKCITNFALTTQNDDLKHWKQLLDYNNGRKGVIVGIDEIQNWFKSGNNQLPEEMLEIVTQNRKNRRIIVASSQVLTRTNKAIREQSTLIYEPITFLRCFTVVHVTKPVIDTEGNIIKKKHKRFYSFVHTDELRNCYDTYKVIHTLSKVGFKEPVASPTINAYLVSK